MGTFGRWVPLVFTLVARGFSCAVSGFGQLLKSDPHFFLFLFFFVFSLRSSADETKLPVAREKKPLVPRVPGFRFGYNDPNDLRWQILIWIISKERTLTVIETRTRLQRHSDSLCLEIRWRNEEAINFTRNRIYSLNVFYFLLYRRRFFLFLNWFSTVKTRV